MSKLIETSLITISLYFTYTPSSSSSSFIQSNINV